MGIKRYQKTAAVSLVITLILWTALLLYQMRVASIFIDVLMIFPGTYTVFGAMAGLPILLIIMGIKISRHAQRWYGRAYTGAGVLFFIAFSIVLGIPLTIKALTPPTPRNPGTPRPVPAQTGLPVFPGAEGFGTRTPAGRGGKIIAVTSLADAGPGTLRAALNEISSCIIVFRVGGIIELNGALYISHPFVTIAGQTAPGGGICIKNAGITIATHDVLIQHIRIRPGNKGNVEAENNDAVSILGKHGEIDGAYNVVLDHISASWGEDETVSAWYGAHDITVSWSIISEALNVSRHRKRTHSAGLLIGDGSYHVSIHHTLLAHNDFRNPLFIEGGTHDFINNVIYNWGVLPAEIVDYDSNSFLNFIGNYFRPGPSTQSGPYEILIGPESGTPKIYSEGNIGPHRPDANTDEWALVGYGYGEKGVAPEIYRSHSRYNTSSFTITSATEALDTVLAQAGAAVPQRDAVDNRIVTDVRNTSGKIINSPEEAGGYPAYESGVAPTDTDRDGMPDLWETKMKLDPLDASDGKNDLDEDGYTNIEEYLHSLCNRMGSIAIENKYMTANTSEGGIREMKRYGMVIGLREEKIEEYKKLHASVWPDVLKTIEDCNIQNYSIYLRKLDDEQYYLFSYFEYTGEDFQKDMEKMAADPTTQKWWDVCKPCQKPLEDCAEGEWWTQMEEVFHCG